MGLNIPLRSPSGNISICGNISGSFRTISGGSRKVDNDSEMAILVDNSVSFDYKGSWNCSSQILCTRSNCQSFLLTWCFETMGWKYLKSAEFWFSGEWVAPRRCFSSCGTCYKKNDDSYFLTQMLLEGLEKIPEEAFSTLVPVMAVRD